MSSFAYRSVNKENKDIVEIEDAYKDSKGTDYYCPGDKCTAILHFVDDKKHPHFAALRSHPHITGCNYAADNKTYNDHDYDESKFNFDKVIDNLINGSSNYNSGSRIPTHTLTSPISKGKPSIRTLGMLYKMCKAHHIYDEYNNIKIWKILVDKRSCLKIYKNNSWWGKKIVEGKFNNYDSSQSEYQDIYLSINVNESKVVFRLVFKNDLNLFDFYKRRIVKNRNHKIVIAGDWHTDKNDQSYCYIKSRRQMIII